MQRPGDEHHAGLGDSAQNVGGDQGDANATERGSGTNTATTVVVNALAAQEVTITMEGGQPAVKVLANPDAKVTVSGASFGNVIFGERSMAADVSSAGGGDAARETGGDQVRETRAVREPRAPRAPRATTPEPGGGD